MADKLLHRQFLEGFRWQDVDQLKYKEEGVAPFRDITRQVLFSDEALRCELRYFEMQSDGYSSLERHEHAHAVMIFRGTGHCLLGDEVRSVSQNDLVKIPAMTWHQFRATQGAPMGFLCMVNVERDRPQLPDEDELMDLKSDPKIASFLVGRV
jgi:quercetin dioxygenase-like cupin family protein